MAIWDNLFKNKKESKKMVNNETIVNDIEKKVIYDNIVFADDELVSIAVDGIIDLNSPLTIEKYKHNMSVLAKRTKEKKEVEKLMLIRDDNYFPFDYEWRVASDVTCLEKSYLELSREVREYYAIEKFDLAGEIEGIRLPVSKDALDKALCELDLDMVALLGPVHFRSTKHFTLNTPLGVTGSYNGVSDNRNFTIIDNIDNFLSSGYAYSVADHDAYLDVTHESLPISKDAVILMEKSKYDNLIKNPLIFEHLKQRRVVLYKKLNKENEVNDSEFLAINMLLSELGAIPTKSGPKYYFYDEELKKIIKDSIKKLAKDNGLLYDKSHSGSNGHFTDYYDRKNFDYLKSIKEFADFMKTKFPDKAEYFTLNSVRDSSMSSKIVEKIGPKLLLDAIKEYNLYIQRKFADKYNEYKKDRKSITPEVSNYFKSTVKRISKYYNNFEEINYSYEVVTQIEECILHFYQDKTVKEQLEAAHKLWDVLNNKLNVSIEENPNDLNNSFKI